MEDTTIADEYFRITASGAYVPGTMPFDMGSQWTGIILIMCLGGSGQIVINGRPYPLKEGILATVMPHQSVTLSIQDGFRMQGIAFTFDFIADFPFSLKPRVPEKIIGMPCIALSEEQQRILSQNHALLLCQYERTNHPSRPAILKSLVFSFLSEVSYIYCKQKTATSCTHRENIVHDFFGLLHPFHNKHREPSFYADKLCLTSKYLSQTIRQVTGKSLYGWITEFVITDAKKLLLTSDLTISEISDKLSFPNPSFFGRYFKKHTGLTPLRFRQVGVCGKREDTGGGNRII